MVECMRPSLGHLRESGLMMADEREGTLTKLEELWPATFRQLPGSGQFIASNSKQMTSLRVSAASLRQTGQENQPPTGHFLPKESMRSQYGLQTAEQQQKVRDSDKKLRKGKRYSVTPYVEPAKKISLRSSSVRCSRLLQTKPAIHQRKPSRPASTEGEMSTRISQLKSQTNQQNKVLLRRPSKKLSGSRITNQVYLTPSQHMALLQHQLAEQIELSKQAVAMMNSRNMSASVCPVVYRSHSSYAKIRAPHYHSMRMHQSMPKIFSSSRPIVLSESTYPRMRPEHGPDSPFDAYFARSRTTPLATLQPPHQRYYSMAIMPST